MTKNQSFLFFFLILLCVILLLMVVTGPQHWRADEGSARAEDTMMQAKAKITPVMFPEILVLHARRYSEMKLPDVYKLIHQGTMGPGHLNVDRDAFLAYLQREVEQMRDETPWPGDTVLVETLGDRFVRVHLRPYLEHGGSLEAMADAFQRSLNVPRDTGLFYQRMRLIQHNGGSVDTALPDLSELPELLEMAREKEVPPAVHHSDEFKQTYQPHYRVLSFAEAEKLIANLP